MIFSSVIYLELFIAVFFLPGFFLTIILGIKKFRFLLSFALSYSLLVLTLLPFEYYALPIVRWQWCVLLALVILAALAVVKTFIYGNSKKVGPHSLCGRKDGGWTRLSSPTICKSFRRYILIRHIFTPRLTVPLVLAGMICGYLAYAGPYLEMPADAWEHVHRFKWFETGAIEKGVFASGASLATLLIHPLRWYFIHAWLCHVSGLPVIDSLSVLTFINVLVFLLAVYYFGLFLFAGLRVSVLKKTMMAASTALFAGATMGNMVFAYIRYYALAPTILNYALFLAAMAVIIAWLRSNHWSGPALWIAPVLLIVTGLIHTQEALFIFFMTLALSIAETTRICWRKIMYRQTYRFWRHAETMEILPTPASGHPSKGGELARASSGSDATTPRQVLIPSREGQGWVTHHWSGGEWKTVILTAALLLVFFTGYGAIRHFRPGSWISPNMILPHVGVPLEPVNFIFRDLMISPPANPFLRLIIYQLFVFYQVVGCWGLFVYLLFALMIRRFAKIPYLIAGLIVVPLLTVFNPLTIDLMVRMRQAAALYRFIYLIPLPFAGGYLIVYFFCKAREWLRGTRLSSFSVDQPPPRLAATPPEEGTSSLPQADPPAAESSGTRAYDPLLGGVRDLSRRSPDSLEIGTKGEAGGGANISRRRLVHWVNFFGSILVLAGLIGLVFPINAAGIYAPYSKIYTLRKIPAGNDYRLYDDLGKFMAKYKNKVILSDGWTAGFLWYFSPKNTYGWLRWFSSLQPEQNQPDPYTWEDLRGRGLIVVNGRDGAASITGKIARHWPEDVLQKISRSYSIEARNYLESHPEKFRKIWTRNQIAVYAVQ